MGARPETDGRIERSRRNRQAIVDALLELIAEGELLPTGEQVAARAGVGLRTVFRHFEDMDSLHAEIHTRVRGLVRPLLDDPVSDGTLEDRVRSLVQQRANAYERMTPFMRSGEIQRWRSAFLQQTHAETVRELRANLRRKLPEIESLAPPVQQAVELVTSYEAWSRLRQEQGLGRERATETMRAALMSVLRP